MDTFNQLSLDIVKQLVNKCKQQHFRPFKIIETKNKAKLYYNQW